MGNTDEAEYEIYAIRYAHDGNRKLSDNFLPPLIEPADLHNSLMPLDFFVWVLKSKTRTIMVDSGFDGVEAGRRNRELLFPVEQGLKALAISPDAVSDVVVTHMHWDHAGNHDLFPNARYHVQDKEMRYCTGRCMCQPFVKRPFAVDDVTAMVRRIYAGNVQFHDGVGHVAPGVTVHLVGGHSEGLQVVRVKTARGYVCLASDASHYYGNFLQSRPFPLLSNTIDALEAFSIVKSLSSSLDHVIPGHDPSVLARYPRFREDLVHIARLDVEPNA